MKILQYLSAVAVLLLAFSETTTADLYDELKHGLLTSTNIRTLQTIFYNDGFECCCPDIDYWCRTPSNSVTFTLHISTNSWNIKSYLEKFFDYFQFTDLIFFRILSTLKNYRDANNLGLLYEEKYVITIILSNTTYFNSQDELSWYSPIISLFKWVSVSYLKLYTVKNRV